MAHLNKLLGHHFNRRENVKPAKRYNHSLEAKTSMGPCISFKIIFIPLLSYY